MNAKDKSMMVHQHPSSSSAAARQFFSKKCIGIRSPSLI
jgi:hypothetical protein